MHEVESVGFREKLDQIREIGAARLDKADRDPFLGALDQLFTNSSPDDLVDFEAEEIYGSTLALWKFAAHRKPGVASARMYNPRMSEQGWSCSHTVLEIVNDDMPFLVDSVIAFLTERGLGIHSLIHPVLAVKRGAEGERIELLGSAAEGGISESLIQVQLDQIGDEAKLSQYRSELVQVMRDVRLSVADWKPMMARLADATDALRKGAPKKAKGATADAIEFLEWLAENHFTFLGYREFRIDAGGTSFSQVDGASLGLMRDTKFTVLRDPDGNFADWSPEMDVFVSDVSPLMVIKANRRSTVHRPTHFDLIGVKKFDAKGKVIGEHVFIGHFTATAYNRSPRAIPLLRQKVQRLIEQAGFAPTSHDGKALTNVLETYPRDELFQSSDEQLYRNAMGVLHLATRPRTCLFVRPDRFGRFVSCLIYIPRERYNTERRVKIGEILSEGFEGRIANWTPTFVSDVLTRLHFVIALTGKDASTRDTADIEAQIVAAVRSWGDHLRDALVDVKGEHEGNRLHSLYSAGFNAAYQDDFNAVMAIADVERMENLSDPAELEMKFYRRLEDPESSVRFKLFRLDAAVPLSDSLPMLENMGFRILEEHPFTVIRGGQEIWIHDFLMRSATGADVDISSLREKLEETFASLWADAIDDDPLNRLVLVAGLTVRETALLRAYGSFLRQAKIPYSVTYMEDSLIENPGFARLFVELFQTLFDPAKKVADREAEAAKISGKIEAALEAVASLDVDRILRRFHNAIQSTLRTNYYQSDADGQLKRYFSFKFDSSELEDLPDPRPWREIFVYSTKVEGVHLRFGPVARGGLRWSDRREDYRTETLGLVKAQQAKNAVIVPVGSKGGFLPKSLPANAPRDEVVAEAVRCYRIFLSGMLDITDNISGADIVPPDSVVRRDDDDPYLVVAADKGTATFSDFANELSEERGFWLGDAFASGGSNGYDHKGMGITAKGAWEAVKRHFRELDHDTQTQPFSVIGCGDMSGDVFGNGMLLSEQIRLIAAFDHRDIFIDPDPDPAKTFAERKRLFELPRSSWRSYDEKLISKGGGIFSRSAKSIELTSEIRAMTGLDEKSVTPFELINALMKSKADLLWFGGIGTYIKSPDETHLNIGDRANDSVRVDATEVQARVIGEGGNLAVSQRGRVQLAKRGVKVNNDAIDNSAGVDCSDHEVNIKIALGAVMAAGDMTEKQRNNLLAKMTDEVSALVLKDNYDQTLAMSLVEVVAPKLIEEHAQFLRALEAAGKLDRAVEFLPNDEEVSERKAAGVGLTRPEIAVMLAYAKIDIFSELVLTDVPDDPYMERFLFEYMPTPIQSKYKNVLRSHRLRREIIATVACNLIANEAGPARYFRMREETGASIGEIVKAFIIAREVFSLPNIAAEVNALDNKISAAVQNKIQLALSDTAAAQTRRLAQQGDRSIGEAIELYKSGVEAIEAVAGTTISAYSQQRLTSRTNELVAKGAPKALAARVAALELLGGAIDIVDIAEQLNRDVADVAANYFSAGARFGLDWLRSKARSVEVANHWERKALGRLMAGLRAQQSGIGAAALTLSDAQPGESSVAEWAEKNAQLTMRMDQLIDQLQSEGDLSVAKLALVSSQLTAGGC